MFVDDECPLCPDAVRACEGIDDLHVFDVSRVEGMAEAAHHSVVEVPSIVVIDSDGREVAAWRGSVPEPGRLRAVLAN